MEGDDIGGAFLALGFLGNRDRVAEMAPLDSESEELLGWLCREWGFCLMGDGYENIVTSNRLEAQEFALKVLKAEGFPSPERETEWLRRISARFMDHFGASVVQASEFKL